MDGLRREGRLLENRVGLKVMRGNHYGNEKDAYLSGRTLERFAGGVGECVGVETVDKALLTVNRDRGG